MNNSKINILLLLGASLSAQAMFGQEVAEMLENNDEWDIDAVVTDWSPVEESTCMDNTVYNNDNPTVSNTQKTRTCQIPEISEKRPVQYHSVEELQQMITAAVQAAMQNQQICGKPEEPKVNKAAAIFGLSWRLIAFFAYVRYALPDIKTAWDNKDAGDALAEILKASVVAWFLTDKIKDYAKPIFDPINTGFDNWVVSYFYSEPAPEIALA